MGLVLDTEALAASLADLKASGRTVALANGHFDLLHVGHLRYLQASAAEADVLVVAINDDDSVKRLKGPGRPVVPAVERAELLAALEPVDFVTVFAGDSPAPLLARLQPDVRLILPYAAASPPPSTQAGEGDPVRMPPGWASWLSPVALALMNAKVGQRVRFKYPCGEENLEVLAIRYD